MSKIKSAQVTEPKGSFGIVEREQLEPGRGQVRITVEACGVCRSDTGFIDGTFPGTRFPLVAGHEIAGRIDAIGEDVEDWSFGQRVAVGWFGGNCGRCVPCRAGDFMHCERLKIPGYSYPGGYSESVIAPATALAQIPDSLSAVEAAPMGCAGVTTFNALRRSAAKPGDLVAVIGLGGVGHLGVQFARQLGFETVAIGRGDAQAGLAAELGAHHYLDSTADGPVAKQLQAIGGAKVVLATVASSEAMSATIDGLRPTGELVVIGITPEPIQVSPDQIVIPGKTVHGHPSGTAREVEETLHFAALTGVRPMTETRPLGDIQGAYDRMLSGDARFRMVVTTGL
ncbi:MAG TPA: alcohol dehydrogenase catalytic domain-containing protein [Trebonia sp.]|nr:alcohol dehydrogenase catalytic domain-containing protein [Trebonia sp.]